MPSAATESSRICKYGTPCAATSGSGLSCATSQGAMRISTTVIGIPIRSESSRPPLSGIAVSSRRPSPTRLAAIACTATDSPVTAAIATKLTKLDNPTPASAAGPSWPTKAVSTRLRMFCEVMPPMIGSDSAQISRRRVGEGVTTKAAQSGVG